MAEEKVEKKEEKTAVAEAKDEEKKEQKKEASKKLEGKVADILKAIEEMTVIELSDLVKALQDKFGIEAMAPMMAGSAVAGAQAAGAGAAEEEKSTFTVVLASVGANKIQVIKEIRALTNLGLKEAKDLVDTAPKPVKESVPKQEAEEIKKKLESAGAKVELK